MHMHKQLWMITKVDVTKDSLMERLMKQDLYVPYVAAINIWNNLIFGNLPQTENLLSNLHNTLQRLKKKVVRI